MLSKWVIDNRLNLDLDIGNKATGQCESQRYVIRQAPRVPHPSTLSFVPGNGGHCVMSVCSQGRWGVPQGTETQLLARLPKKTNLGVVSDTPGNICLHFYAAVWTQQENCSKIHSFPTRQSPGIRPLPLRALKVSRNFGRGDMFVSDNLFECSICLFPIRLNLASLVLKCFSRWCKFLTGKSPLETPSTWVSLLGVQFTRAASRWQIFTFSLSTLEIHCWGNTCTPFWERPAFGCEFNHSV